MGKGPNESISLHCIICYECFDAAERPPVVLPCGHTFICEPCAKRLDKCMECRTPLIVSNPQPSQLTHTASMPAGRTWANRPVSPVNTLRSALSSRSPRSPPRSPNPASPSSPKRSEEPVALPTPKNIVLLNLIESMKEGVDDDEKSSYEDDQETVRNSVNMLRDTCGTYVVRTTGGLSVYDKPKDIDDDCSRDSSWSSSLLSSFSQQPPPKPSPKKEIKKLVYGQTVQIASIEDGIATVAREKGYIFLKKSSHLVKVGHVKDELCQVEAKHRATGARLQKLKQSLEKLKKVEQDLQDQMKAVMDNPKPDDPFGPVPNKSTIRGSSSPSSSSSSKKKAPRQLLDVLAAERHLRLTQDGASVRSCSAIYGTRNKLKCDDESTVALNALGCGDLLRDFNCDRYCLAPRSRSIPSVTPASAIARRGDGRDNGRGDGRSIGRGEGRVLQVPAGIDFATGLSGHTGLSQAQKTKACNQIPRREVRMYGEHKGAGGIGPCNTVRSTGNAW